ncbi:hypothetical protein FRB94_000877 [Tulasnella sp. JGI-2019a]|nr:hypothetical protein FRB94_000877 [Tulasnella sp. JGI-2019a]
MNHTIVEAPSDDAHFLSLVLVDKEYKVQLSQTEIAIDDWPGRLSLFAISNKTGYFVAARNASFVVAPISALRNGFTSSSSKFPQYVNTTTSEPVSVKFACDGKRFVICTRDGRVQVYATPTRVPVLGGLSSSSLPLIYEFTHSDAPIRDVQPNPSDKPETIAVLRGNRNALSEVDIIDVQALDVVGIVLAHPDSATPFQTAICWSPKGKQIAIGDASGHVRHYGTDGSLKSSVSPTEEKQPALEVVSILWIENNTSLIVYSNPAEQHEYITYVVTLDTKANAATDYLLEDPVPPYGLESRESARTYLHLKSWNPLKHLVLVADAPAVEIGVIGGSDDPKFPWTKLELDETVRATVPMEEDGTQLTLVGFDIDFTSTTPISTSTQFDDDNPSLPAAPIIYLYTNDGFVVAYHVLNSDTPSYSEMTPTEATNTGEPTPAPVVSTPSAKPVAPTTTPAGPPLKPAFGFGQGNFGAATAFGQASTTPVGTPAKTVTSAFGQPAFGAAAASALSGQSSSFGSGTFGAAKPTTTTPDGKAPAFGQSGFGTSAFAVNKTAAGSVGGGAPAFGQSGFGAFSNKPGTSTTFGAPAAVGGGGRFGSFASRGTSGFGGLETGGSGNTAAPNTSTPPVFGATGFGGFASKGTTGFGFGAVAPTPAQTTGFGAPSSSSLPTTKPAQAFGSTAGAFGSANTTARGFGGSKPPSKFSDILPGTGAFGKTAPVTPSAQAPVSTTPKKPLTESVSKKDESTTPGGGKPVFGSVGFGAPAVIKKPASIQPVTVTAGAGFGSFGSGGFSGFAAPAASSGSSFADMLSTGTSKSAPAVKPAAITTKFQPSTSSSAFSARSAEAKGDDDEKDDEQAESPKSEPEDLEPAPGKRATPKTAVPASAFSTMSFGSSQPGPSSSTPSLSKPSLFTTIGTTPPASAFSSMSFGTVQPGPTSSSTPSGQRQSVFFSQPPTSTTSTFPPMSTGLTQTITIPTGSSDTELSISADGDGTADGSDEGVEETDEEGRGNEETTVAPTEEGEEGESDEDEADGEEGTEEVLARNSRSPTLSPVAEADESEELEEPTTLGESSYIMPPNPAQKHTPPSATTASGPGEPSSPQDEATTPIGSPARPHRSASPSTTPRASRVMQSDSALGITTFGSSGGRVPPSTLGRSLFSATPVRSSPLSANPLKAASPTQPQVVLAQESSFGRSIQSGDEAKTVADGPSFHMPQPKPVISVPVGMPLRDLEEVHKPRARSQTPPLSSFGLGFGSSTKIQPANLFGATAAPPAPANSLFKAPPFSFGGAKAASPVPDGAIPPLMDNVAPAASWMKPTVPNVTGTKSKITSFGSQSPTPTLPPPPPPPVAPKLTGMEEEFVKIIALTERELKKLSEILSLTKSQQQSTVKLNTQGHHPSSTGSSTGGWKLLRPKILALEEDVKQLDRLGSEMARTTLGLKESDVKANVRIQEIKLLIAARDDKEKKAEKEKKQLGPEYEEKQVRLQRIAQTVSDRIDQLERFIAEEKRKLDQAKTGKQGVQMPTLEAIGRALNRIQKAAQVKLKQIDFLQERVQALAPDDTDMFGDELVRSDGLPKKAGSTIQTSSSIARPSQDASETLVDAAVALNSERSAKRLRESLLEARPSAPRLNRSAVDKIRKPGHANMRTRMPATAHLKLTRTLEQDGSLPSWTKASLPASGTSNQVSRTGAANSLVKKTNDASDRPKAVPTTTNTFGLPTQVSFSPKPKMEFSLAGRRTAPTLGETPPRVGPISRHSTRRGFGLHMTEN